MTHTLLFVPITRGDLDTIVEIDHKCFEADVAYSHEEMAYFLNMEGTRGLMAREGSGVLGFVLWNQNHIITLDVLPAVRRRGLGVNLMKRALGLIRESGYGRSYLEVDVDNEEALALYSGLGYGTVTTFRESGRERYLMALDLESNV